MGIWLSKTYCKIEFYHGDYQEKLGYTSKIHLGSTCLTGWTSKITLSMFRCTTFKKTQFIVNSPHVLRVGVVSYSLCAMFIDSREAEHSAG